jgi:hypothetical protein
MTKRGIFTTYSFLASYLVNRDASGLSDNLKAIADKAVAQVEKRVCAKIDIVDCVSDGFAYPTYPSNSGLAKGDCSVYTYLYKEA